MPGRNKLFRIESSLIAWVFLVILILGFLGTYYYPQIVIMSEIDRCLDLGGSFDYDSCSCDYNTSHKYKENHSCS